MNHKPTRNYYNIIKIRCVYRNWKIRFACKSWICINAAKSIDLVAGALGNLLTKGFPIFHWVIYYLIKTFCVRGFALPSADMAINCYYAWLVINSTQFFQCQGHLFKIIDGNSTIWLLKKRICNFTHKSSFDIANMYKILRRLPTRCLRLNFNLWYLLLF